MKYQTSRTKTLSFLTAVTLAIRIVDQQELLTTLLMVRGRPGTRGNPPPAPCYGNLSSAITTIKYQVELRRSQTPRKHRPRSANVLLKSNESKHHKDGKADLRFSPVSCFVGDAEDNLSRMSQPAKIKVTLSRIAKMIDHSLLHPTMTDQEIQDGLDIARKCQTATACIKPYAIAQAKKALQGSGVKVCPVIGFPAGNSTIEVKVFEAEKAAEAGGDEIDMVVNIGKVLSGEWDYVTEEIHAINTAVTNKGAILKVIFENDFLQDEHIIRLCEICSSLDVAFVKTSTGYGFVKQPNGLYTYKGATVPHLKLMRKHSKPEVQIKAAGGVRTLDDLLYVMSIGVTRIGATATVAILDEARKRGIGEEPVEVEVKPMAGATANGAAY